MNIDREDMSAQRPGSIIYTAILAFLLGGTSGYLLRGCGGHDESESDRTGGDVVMPPVAELPVENSADTGEPVGWGDDSAVLIPIPERTHNPLDTPVITTRILSHKDEPVIPVLGVKPSDLYDSYGDGRSGGRAHQALDIIAPEGTPVVAAVRGSILRYFRSEKGGETIYQRGEDGLIYYYAHLQRYEPGIDEGDVVRAGTVIGYVGNSGNAGPDNYHLHFAIWRPTSEKSYWDGEAINPYPLLSR